MGRRAKKKVVRDAVDSQSDSDAASGSSGGDNIIDPLKFLNLDIQSFDIPRLVSIYPDKFGVHWWTKSWFNGHKKGEKAIAIKREQVMAFLHDTISKDDWLEQYYPKQMQLYHQAMEQTTKQLLQAYNIQM